MMIKNCWNISESKRVYIDNSNRNAEPQDVDIAADFDNVVVSW